MGYAELYQNGHAELAIAVLAAVLIMVFVLAILWAHSESEETVRRDLDAQLRAMEDAHRASVYGNAKENA